MLATAISKVFFDRTLSQAEIEELSTCAIPAAVSAGTLAGIVALLKQIIAEVGPALPAIEAALAAAGIVLPPWLTALLPVLVGILTKTA